MKFSKPFSFALLALAAGAASAATQPINPVTSSTVTFDTTKLASNSFTATALGNSTYNSSTGVLTDSIASVSLGTTGAGTVAYNATSGIGLTTSIAFVGTVNVNLTNFFYNFADNTLYGDVFVTALGSNLSYASQAILVAANEAGTLGTSNLNSATSSTTARDLNMSLSSFTLAADLSTKLGNAVTFVSWLPGAVTGVNVKTTATPSVPEPSTYALMGIGLLGVAIARRKKA
jgi:hypothetical protein